MYFILFNKNTKTLNKTLFIKKIEVISVEIKILKDEQRRISNKVHGFPS
jgi:hypothetical protein